VGARGAGESGHADDLQRSPTENSPARRLAGEGRGAYAGNAHAPTPARPTKPMREPRSILITGASSGIGEALARLYAGPGTTLALSGRDAARLEAVAAACRAAGAAVSAATVDATHRAGMAGWIAACDAARPLDLVVANAGVDGTAVAETERARFLVEVNVVGVLNTLEPAIEAMRPRRRGQLAIVSSLAGFRGMPGAPAYGASKAAVRSLGEGLRGRLARDGLEVAVVCPGFVTSRMTANNRFPMPFLMDAERAARIVRDGLAKGRGRIAFPWPMYAAVWLLNALPDGLAHRLTRRLPDKA